MKTVNYIEVWRPIKGFEQIYQVSDLGNVQRIKTKRVLIPHIRRRYYAVSLSKNNTWKSYSVHRIVATAFIANRKGYPQVNHIDGNRLNNTVSNLEWCTPKRNTNHSFEIGIRKHLERDDKGRFKAL